MTGSLRLVGRVAVPPDVGTGTSRGICADYECVPEQIRDESVPEQTRDESVPEQTRDDGRSGRWLSRAR